MRHATSPCEDGAVQADRGDRQVAPQHRDGSVVGPPTFGGLLAALLFWWPSLTPTLVPRPWVAQAVMSAVCVAVGYGIGTAVGRWVQRYLTRRGHSPSPGVRRWGWIT